jgi:glycosyltransferase involved in cell wall biosynthesis
MRTHRVPEERICVIRNGVDVERFRPLDRAALRQAHAIEGETPLVGMVAAFKRQKGHADFFRMASAVLTRFPDARFLCVGEPLRDNQQGAEDYHREMQALVDSLGVRDRTIFWGAREDMPEVYNLCDVIVLPSRREGTPNVLLEAMACGVPVVANDVADNRYVVPEGETGFVVPLDDVEALTDRVCRLLESPGLRERMGKAGTAWVRREFSLGALTERTGAAYLRLARPDSVAASLARA